MYLVHALQAITIPSRTLPSAFPCPSLIAGFVAELKQRSFNRADSMQMVPISHAFCFVPAPAYANELPHSLRKNK